MGKSARKRNGRKKAGWESGVPENDVVRMEPLFSELFVRIFGMEDSKNMTRSLVNAILVGAGLEPIGEIKEISAERTLLAGSVE